MEQTKKQKDELLGMLKEQGAVPSIPETILNADGEWEIRTTDREGRELIVTAEFSKPGTVFAYWKEYADGGK